MPFPLFGRVGTAFLLKVGLFEILVGEPGQFRQMDLQPCLQKLIAVNRDREPAFLGVDMVTAVNFVAGSSLFARGSSPRLDPLRASHYDLYYSPLASRLVLAYLDGQAALDSFI
jgi:hypothetical protein